MTAALDEKAWECQAGVEVGQLSEADYLEAFRRARAAATVGFALGSDALQAALESVCEAQAATGHIEEVRRAVVGVFE
ncbi:hypothetical protein [Gryllotalpicola koreensis]|uniref:hypothetical protein n=1 Tax=Gryllotalpicola koreensis TaxID=993086 RepID=UPI0031CDFF98